MNTHIKAAATFAPKSPQTKIKTSLQRHSINNSLTVNTINYPNFLCRKSKLSLPGNLQTIQKRTSNNSVEQTKKYSKNIDPQINFKKSLDCTLKTIDMSASKNTIQPFKIIPEIQTSQLSKRQKKYGALRLINRFKFNILYKYRWGNGSWKSRILSPNVSRYHDWKYGSSKPRSPNFQIKFDADLRTNKKYPRTRFLKRYQSSGPPHQNAKKYYFARASAHELDILSSEKLPLNKVKYKNSKTVPGLKARTVRETNALIKNNKFQQALDKIVAELASSGRIKTALLKNGKMNYRKKYLGKEIGEGLALYPGFIGQGENKKAKPAEVYIGPKAFSFGIFWLYSTIMHEYQHVIQYQVPKSSSSLVPNQDWDIQKNYQKEVEAYAWELINSKKTGLFKNKIYMNECYRRLHENYWIDMLDEYKKPLKKLVKKAYKITKQAVGKDINLPYPK